MIARTAPEWPGLKLWLLQKIEEKRQSLESETVGIKEADLLRGEIRFIRALIATVEPESFASTGMTKPEGSNY